MSLWVNEIFYSLQGETSQVGRPCVFVRLTGCNLRCSYCDTTYAYDEGILMATEEVKRRIQDYHCPLVAITGGEPLLQQDILPFITHLLDQGWEVLLETNGSLSIGLVDIRCQRIVDIKLPASGESNRMDLGNIALLSPHDEIKFVIASATDYDCAREIVTQYPSLRARTRPPLFSPASPQLDPQLLATWILRDHLDVRLQVPLHKVLWGTKRGV